MSVHLLGIRHHGPGSCRNVVNALQAWQPDLVLLEGPAEAEPLVSLVGHPDMKPPVALLAYQTDLPSNAVFYPFADFSPEWQTMRYALDNGVPLRFFDLPLTHLMALAAEDQEQTADETKTDPHETTEESAEDETTATDLGDPFDALAEAAGLPDGESWWELNVEQRRQSDHIFQAVAEAVAALREELNRPADRRDQLREAWMRKSIRAAQREGYERIAVVCGAWHVPALEAPVKAKDDNELLKGLPKVKVACTWIPWTYDRLSLRSGYGAGIASPGWYHYLWHHPDDDGTLWVSRVARLLRQQGMDVSVAHVIETVRLAQTAAALRNLPHPSLEEYNEAVTSVMGFGDHTLLGLIRESLIISNRLGQVPDGVPQVPLLADVLKTQKRLRVPFTAEIKELTLDLRKPNDLERSIFFHRLRLLDIDWAIPGKADGKGTFKENWALHHKPEQIVCLIEKAVWGNTLQAAAQTYVTHLAADVHHIPELTHLLDGVIPADLPALTDVLTNRLDSLSAASTDVLEMMEAIPLLADIVRYGNVRALDFSQIRGMLQALMARILAGGLLACIHIDEEAAADLLEHLTPTHRAVSTLNDAEVGALWTDFIRQLHTANDVHPLLSGFATRLLNDLGELSTQEMQAALAYHSSVGNPPLDMACWLEGFLHASGTILLLNDPLWELVNDWICQLPTETFHELLPVIRRTFSEFTPAERRKLGEKAKAHGATPTDPSPTDNAPCHEADANSVLPLMCRLLGIRAEEDSPINP